MNSTMSRLENAIHEAFRLAFMLAATLDDCNNEDEKREAISFGVLKLLDFSRETKEIYRQLRKIQGKAAREEAVLLH
jgi:hypothetical protein